MEPLVAVDGVLVHSVAPGIDTLHRETLEASGQLSILPAALASDAHTDDTTSATLALVCGDFAYLCVPGQPVSMSFSPDRGVCIMLATAPGCHIRVTLEGPQGPEHSELCKVIEVLACAGFEIFLEGEPDALPSDTDFSALATQHAKATALADDDLAEPREAVASQPKSSDDSVAKSAPRWSQSIAAGLGAAAAVTAIGVKAVAGAATYGVHTVGGAINSRVTPRSNEPMRVSDASKRRIAAVKAASDKSLRTTGALAAKVESTTGALGASLANRLTARYTSRAVTAPTAAAAARGTASPHGAMPCSVSEEGPTEPAPAPRSGSVLPQGLVQGLFLVGRAGFAAANTVWEEVEVGAAGVGGAVQEHSVLFAQKRYGEEVATATGEALKAAGGFVWSAYRLNGLGLKSAVSGVAKSTAKESAKTLMA